MKIRQLTLENYDKASALLRQAFPKTTYEVQLVENLHKNGRVLHEWVCIHTNRVVAYIAFSNAYKGTIYRPQGITMTKNCSIKPINLSSIEAISLQNPVNDYQEAVRFAKEQAERIFEDSMLISWYDRDRDFESPPHTTETPGDVPKDGYIHYALSHGAKLKVDIEDGRFVFFFSPVEWS